MTIKVEEAFCEIMGVPNGNGKELWGIYYALREKGWGVEKGYLVKTDAGISYRCRCRNNMFLREILRDDQSEDGWWLIHECTVEALHKAIFGREK